MAVTMERKKVEDMSFDELVKLRDWMLKRTKYLNFLISEFGVNNPSVGGN